MSLYEILAIAALAGVGGFAYYLYRSDIRDKPPGSEARETPPGDLMFKRASKDRNSKE